MPEVGVDHAGAGLSSEGGISLWRSGQLLPPNLGTRHARAGAPHPLPRLPLIPATQPTPCAQSLPEKHQTLLFSATMPPEIEVLARTYLNKPVSVKVRAR